MNTPPRIPDPSLMKDITVINASLRCFVFGLVGLVPVIGLPFAVAAIVQSRKVGRASGSEWNPAEGYLRAARGIGPLGLLTTAGCLLVLGVIVPGFWHGLTACASGST
jgi:hypothetical protein